MPYSVGLTGGIGSGKSAASDRFGELGAGVVDTDEISRELTAPAGAAMQEIRKQLGPEFITVDGGLDRARMRRLVFADAAARRKLEAFLHPLIRARTRAKLAEITAPYALVAVPLLVETNFGELVDRILVVDAPESAQLERLMRRDAIPKPEASEMIRAQVDRATRLKAAHDIIDNSGTTEATRRQVELAHRRYSDLAAQRARQS